MKKNFLIFALLVGGMAAQEIYSEENIAIKSATIGSVKFNSNVELYEELKDQLQFISRGMNYLEQISQKKIESEHTFWFYTKDVEAVTILRRGLEIEDTKTVLNSLRRRSYFDEKNTVLQVSSPADSEKIFRMLFTRVSHILFYDNSIPEENRNEWFVNGLTSYMGFRARSEMAENYEASEMDSLMMGYYAPYIARENAGELRISGREEWKASLEASPEETYAHASLAFLYFAREYGAEKAVEIHRLTAEKPFEEAFREVTGDKAEKFYKNLEKKFYPEIKEYRKSEDVSVRFP